MPDFEDRLRSEFRALRQRLEVTAPDAAKVFRRPRSRRWLHRPFSVFLGAGLAVGGSTGLALAITGSRPNPVPTTTTTTLAPTTTTSPATTTTVAPALPAAENCDPQLGGSGIEPTLIFIGCATSANNLSNISWNSWSATNATGTATHNVNNCQPDCAFGTFSSVPVEVTLSDAANLGAGYVFTTLTITPMTASGSQEPATNSECELGSLGPCSSGGSVWGFVPDSQ